jgi:hypothetical protein
MIALAVYAGFWIELVHFRNDLNIFIMSHT